MAERPLGYRPGLDGLRGIAVIAVMMFHLGYGWAKGGYLGVSTFFTLSGFLITSLLLHERAITGRTNLGRFWSRRARRLLPAALCGLVLAALVARGLPGMGSAARVDLLAAMADVANWRFLFAGRSYGALFSAPSPVLHYWSLSIEEQFYALFPLMAVIAFRRGGSSCLLRWCVIASIGSFGLLAAAGGFDASDIAYYSTPTRAGELSVGAVAAMLVWHRDHIRHRWRTRPRTRGAVSTLALFVLLALYSLVPQASIALTRGLLPLVAIASAIVVVSTYRETGPARILSWRPLVGLGKISYGLYVYHWPLFLWLTAQRTGASGTALALLRVGTSLLVAIASYHLLERPVREGRWPRPRVSLVVASAAITATAMFAVLVLATAPPNIDFARASAELRAVTRTPPAPAASPRVTVFGDSTALMMAVGLAHWGARTGELRLVSQDTPLGCSISRGGQRSYQGGAGPSNPECDQWAARWPAILAASPTDVAVVMEGPWEVTDRLLPGDTKWRSIGDPVVDRYIHDELLRAVDLLLARVRTVVLITSPDIRSEVPIPNAPASPFPESDPARMARYNEILRQVARERSRVAIVDLNSHLRTLTGGEMDPVLRPDGIHFSTETTDVVAPWIGQAIVAAARA